MAAGRGSRASDARAGTSLSGRSQRGRSDFLSAWGRGGIAASRHLAGAGWPSTRGQAGANRGAVTINRGVVCLS